MSAHEKSQSERAMESAYVSAMLRRGNEPVELELTIHQVAVLTGVVQIALAHADIPPETGEFLRDFVNRCADLLGEIEPALRIAIDSGWGDAGENSVDEIRQGLADLLDGATPAGGLIWFDPVPLAHFDVPVPCAKCGAAVLGTGARACAVPIEFPVPGSAPVRVVTELGPVTAHLCCEACGLAMETS